MKKKTAQITGISFLATLGAALIITSFVNTITNKEEGQAVVTNALSPDKKESGILENTPVPTVIAEAVVVYDPQTKNFLMEKNSSEPLALASVTKLVSGYTARTILDDDEVIETPYGNMRLDNAIRYGLVVSDNAMFDAIAIAAGNKINSSAEPYNDFITAANDLLENTGIQHIRIQNATGLDTAYGASSAGSARDVALFVSLILKTQPELAEWSQVKHVRVTTTSGAPLQGENTNKVIEDIPGALASKTGYTDAAGGNLVTVQNLGLNHPVVVVVLGSTISGRFSDTLKIVEALQQ